MRLNDLKIATALSCFLVAGISAPASAATQTVTVHSANELNNAIMNNTSDVLRIELATDCDISNSNISVDISRGAIAITGPFQQTYKSKGFSINASGSLGSGIQGFSLENILIESTRTDGTLITVDSSANASGSASAFPIRLNAAFDGAGKGASLLSVRKPTGSAVPYIEFEGGTSPVSASNFGKLGSNGGAFYIDGGNLSVVSAGFFSNTAANGGAIYINSAPSTNPQHSIGGTFNNNSASQSGGAIYNKVDGLRVSGTFTNNSAGLHGGAIYNEGTMILGTSTFTGNTAGGRSEAIWNKGKIRIESGTVTFNDAIYNDPTVGSSALYMTGGTLNLNNIYSGGGLTVINANINFGHSTQNGTTYRGTFVEDTNNNTTGFSVDNANISLVDNDISSVNLGNILVGDNVNLAIDADLKADSPVADIVTATSVTSANGGKISLNKVNIITDSTESTVTVKIAEDVIKEHIALATNPTVISPNDYSYLLSYDSSTGYLGFTNESAVANLVSAVRDTASSRVYDMAAEESLKLLEQWAAVQAQS